MGEALESKVPTQRTGMELVMCPICFGHTKLLAGKVYCPNCAIIISENVTDSLKTKVELIKEQVAAQKQVPIARSQIKRGLFHSLITGVITFLFLILIAVGSMTGFFFIQGKAYENAGKYAQAKTVFEQSTWFFTMPGIDAAIEKNKRLTASTQEYRRGLAAMKKSAWQEAIEHFENVDEDDKNYNLAQVEMRRAVAEREKESRITN